MHANVSTPVSSLWVLRVFLFVCVAAMLSAGNASATCTGLGCSCSVSADPLNFGTYNPLNVTTVDTVGNVSVTCGALIIGVNFSYEVTLSAGGSGNAQSRTMSNGSSTLSYGLYTNNSRTIDWADGTSGTGTITNSYLLSLITSRTDNFPVYGRLPSGQNVEVGTYSDSIVATVIF